MAHSPVHIKLDPNRCNRCGKCVRVCEPGALKVAPSYIYLDWRACDECMKCVAACDKGAIVPLEHSRRKAGSSQAARKRAPGAHRAGRASDGQTAPGPVGAGRERDRMTAIPRVRTRVNPPVSERIATGGPETWSLPEAAAVLVVAFAALLGKDAALGTSLFAALPDSGRVLVRVLVLSAFYAVQFALLAALARRRGAALLGVLGLARVRARLKSWLSSAGWVALLLVTTRLAAWVWGVASRAVGFDPPRVAEGGFTQVFGAGSPGLILSVVLVVLVAPLAEEMAFRGVVLAALGARWGAAVGLVGSSLAFALYHLTPWQIVPVFILGLACGWLTQHRGSLWPAVVLHALYNAVPVALAFIGAAG